MSLSKKIFILCIVYILFFSFNAYGAEKIIKCDEVNLDKARTLIDSYRGNRSDLENAAKILYKSFENHPDCASAYREFARIIIMARGSGSLEKAELLLKKAIEIDPKYDDAYTLLCSVYLKMDKIEQAKVILSEIEKLGSTSPWYYIRVADIALIDKDVIKAVNNYTKVMNSNKNDAMVKRAKLLAIQGLIDIYKRTGNYNAANVMYNNLLRYDNSAWTHGNYAVFLLYYTGNYEKAISEAEKALSIMDYKSEHQNFFNPFFSHFLRQHSPVPMLTGFFQKKQEPG